MEHTNQNLETTSTRADALEVLEHFSRAAQIAFDRIVAGRALGEAQRAIPGTDTRSWARRLVEVGETLNLRVRSIDGTLRDVLTFVRQGIPVAICVQDQQEAVRWVLLAEVRGRRVRMPSVGGEGVDTWVSLRSLRATLGLTSRDDHRQWVIGQAAFSCEGASDAAHGHAPGEHLSPLKRLFGMIRAERRDLWVVLVFSAVVGVLALATPIAVEALVNTVAFGRYMQPVVVLAILLFTFLGFAAAIRALTTYVVELIQRRMFVRVIEDLAYRLPRIEQRALDHAHGPELVNRFFDIVTVQKVVATLLLDGTAIILQTIVGMAVLAFYHPFLLGFDVVLLLLICLIIFVLGRGAVSTAVDESRVKYQIAGWLEELARHPIAFKLHAGTQFALDRADELAIDWLDARRTHFRIVMRQILFALGLQVVSGTVLLGLGGWLVISGQLSLGQLVAAELIVAMIVGSFSKLGKHMESFYDLLAAMDKLGHLFDLPTEPHNRLFHLQEASPAEISVRGLTYRYDTEDVLNNTSFRVQPSSKVAIVGRAGSGKSTLIDLLCGLRHPHAGHVELDGIDLRELRPDSLREHMAAARGVEVFRGSVAENVHLNRAHISSWDVRQALEAVGLLDEVLRFPDGLNATLQTNGAPLSQSQALRLMLARAIVGRPRLLLIDGTLDSLDDESLRVSLRSLCAPSTPWTLLVTTGRREVIAACQRMITLIPVPRAAGSQLSTT